MKKIGIAIGVLIISGLSMAFMPREQVDVSKIEWISFEEAIERSKKEPRPIFVDVYTHWCGWCKKMDRDTFQNPKVVAYMNKQYYCIKFNAEQKEDVVFPHKTYKSAGKSHELAIELLDRKMSYPSVVYMDKTFAKIQAIPGYRGATEFLPISRFMGEEIYKTKTWEQFQAASTE